MFNGTKNGILYLGVCIAILLTACGGGGGGSGGSGGGTPPPPPPPNPVSFPANADPVAFDTTEVGLGQTKEESIGNPVYDLSEPMEVEYPYDLTNPDAMDPQLTTATVRNACVISTYDITSNPDKVVLYSPDGNTTWPGVMLVGNEYRDGTMRRLPVPEAEREPVTIVIRNVYQQSGAVSREVENPNFASLSQAINDMIVQGYNDDLPIGDSVTLTYEETSDLSRFLLKANISATYGVGSGSLGTKINKTSSERTIVINLVQKLFDVEVQQPTTKEDWFKPSFFTNTLPTLLDNGQISSANAPVYVSKVTYGRIMTFAMTTTASKSDIEAQLKASVKTLTASGSLSLTDKQQNIQSASNFTVTQIGGNGATAISAANSGNWGEFFKENLRLTEAVPIMYEYRNLYDNTRAGATEVTEVTEEVCTPQLVVAGPFDFAPEDFHTRPDDVGAIQQVVSADVNGDGRLDLIWNHLVGNDNNFYIGLGNPAGRFDIVEQACVEDGTAQTCDFSDASIAWGQYELLTGDFNGDGGDDLLWLRKGVNETEIDAYLLAADDNGFTTQLQNVHWDVTSNEVAGLRPDVHIADVNNDNKEDIVLWYITHSRTPLPNNDAQNIIDYQVIQSGSSSDPTVDFSLTKLDRTSADIFIDNYNTSFGNSSDINYTLNIIDIDSDGYKDLVINLLGLENFSLLLPARDRKNVTVWALNQTTVPGATPIFADSTNLGGFLHTAQIGWSFYRLLVGDFSGDGRTDLAWVRNRSTAAVDAGNFGAVHQAIYSQGNGNFTQNSGQFWRNSTVEGDVSQTKVLEQTAKLFEIDVNGDSATDVVATKFLTAGGQANFVNGIAVMKGVKDGNPVFNTSPSVQQHPIQKDWQNYTYTFVGDVNGDGLQDVVWNNAQLINRAYVAVAKIDQDN